MALSKLKKMFNPEDGDQNEEYYSSNSDDTSKKVCESGNNMILVEPRAYSESQQIADHLKNRNAVVVNFKRVTSDQSKRILDFLTGTLYAIGGGMEKLGNGIYLCTPRNIAVQGKMTEEEGKKSSSEDSEW